MVYDACVEVKLREGIADPQGSTIEKATANLGFEGIANVRVGKCIRFQIEAENEIDASSAVQELCDRFLTNPVIEEAVINIQVVE
jgi:phosphoribosylformylglycinamidine synthase PurS subunit